MKTIIARIPNLHDATAHYRANGPLSHLRRTGICGTDILIQTVSDFSGPGVMLSDIGFFQRPSDPKELEAIKLFKRLGKKIIIDYDDFLLGVPGDNPLFGHYASKKSQDTIIEIIRAADAVIVSTNELKRCLQLPKNCLNEKVYVANNAIDEHHMLHGERSIPPLDRNRTVFWRGSQTHQRDLMDYTPAIVKVGRATKAKHNIPFTFSGYNPWFITESLYPEQAIIAGPLPMGEYLDFIYKTGPMMGIVPLAENRFNRCKSNIAWLELTWAGAAMLVPDWEEWKRPGCTTYRNEEDFIIGLTSLIESTPERLHELNRQSWFDIINNYTLAKVNGIREKVFGAAMDLCDWPEGGAPIPEYYTTETRESKLIDE